MNILLKLNRELYFKEKIVLKNLKTKGFKVDLEENHQNYDIIFTNENYKHISNLIKHILNSIKLVEEKIKFLENLYDGCDSIILSCGPSLNDLEITKDLEKNFFNNCSKTCN
jgi:hypothetical protein